MIKKVLILTVGGGAAHDLTALALQQQLSQLYSHHVETRIEDIYAQGNSIANSAVKFYSWIHRNIPWLHYFYFYITENAYVMWWTKTILISGYYKTLIRSYKPDCIVSVYGGYNQRYFQVAKKILGEKTCCVTLCPEFTGGYGFSHHWVDPQECNHFWCHTEAVREQAIKLGMPPQKIWFSSNVLRRNFYDTPLNNEEKYKFLTQELKLNDQKFTILFSTNGSGSQNHIELLKVLLPILEKIQVVILCGNNAKAKNSVSQWCQEHSLLQTAILGFTENIPQLLQISQANVQRAGFLMTAESINCQCPIIFNGIGGIMPQETLAIRHIVSQKMAVTMTHPQQLFSIVNDWLEYPEQYQKIRQNFIDYSQPSTSAQEQIKCLIESLN
jgi:processive 1,2-diacylglycerol beta-glucosyltransferase